MNTWLRALAVAVALAACAPMTWQRPDTSAEQARRDQAECRTIAFDQARGLALRHGLLHRRLFRWRHGHTVFGPDPFFDSPFDSPFYLRQELEYDCLRAKGYALVPAPAG